MLINENDVAKVLDQTDILALIGEHVALKRVGLRYVGLCPFHPENTPSFSVNAEEGFYYCFGCHVSGDAISFVRQIDRLDFVSAVEFLAGRSGVLLTYDSDELASHATKKSSLQSALSRAVEFYHDQLLHSSDAELAREYLNSRGLGNDELERFQIGWAPDTVAALFGHLRVSEEVFVDAGLGYLDKSGRPHDQLRARVIFPIFDTSGKPVAFGGRILPNANEDSHGNPLAKYKNSPETALYSKRKMLYGLNLAKADVVAKGEIIICEGYTDVIAFFKVGIPRAVATCGTALTEDHLSKIKSFSKRIILAFDADNAGVTATEKFYQWEKKHKLEIYVADLPKGIDPGDLGQKDPARLVAAVARAKPFMAFRLRRLFEVGDLTTIEGRARIVDEAVAVISEHPNALVRNDYLMQVADKCRFEMSDLHVRLEQSLRNRNHFGDEVNLGSGPVLAMLATDGQTRIDSGAEIEYKPISAQDLGLSDRPAIEGLKTLVHNLEEMGEFFPLVLFIHPTHRALRIALDGVTQISEAATKAELVGRAAKELFVRLAVQAPTTDPFDVVSRLVERGVNRRLEHMKLEARSLEPASPRLGALSGELARVRHLQEELRSGGSGKIEATGQLLAWLVQTEAEG
ncbi:MAG: DNA primase [Acidimicrobiaceae bacterium]|nr:DNA primase [Acidimicrobiaceae bacterium]